MNSVDRTTNTQNKAWADDTSKFGFRMLEKMGWSAGKGLGRTLEGITSHVVIKKRSENLGLGCSLKQREVIGWSNTSQGFADILADLNNVYTKDNEKKSKKDKKKSKKKKMAKEKKKEVEKSKTPKKSSFSSRILYQKRIRNKNASGYSATDMSAILGAAAAATKASDDSTTMASEAPAAVSSDMTDNSKLEKKQKKKKKKDKSS